MKEKITSFFSNKIVLAVLFLAVGAFLGLWYGHRRAFEQAAVLVRSIHPIRENNSTYQYAYPLLGYDFGNAKQFLQDQNLVKKINDYVKQQYQSNNAESISVYYQNLRDNSRASVNDDAQYHPGSLLKVLIMMAYYREAELDPTILQKTFAYTQDTQKEVDSLQFALPTELQVGQNYTLTQLLQFMIEQSDNGAETLLIDNVNRTLLNNAYTDLGMQNPDTVTGDFTITAPQYSAFLRFLYNATYLTENYSEQVLAMMSKSTYTSGLSAGVPSNITVAQKYGERVQGSGDAVSEVELHDCGIIYAKNNPYELCIMTKGKDVNKLTSSIKDISALVYGYVSSGGKN